MEPRRGRSAQASGPVEARSSAAVMAGRPQSPRSMAAEIRASGSIGRSHGRSAAVTTLYGRRDPRFGKRRRQSQKDYRSVLARTRPGRPALTAPRACPEPAQGLPGLTRGPGSGHRQSFGDYQRPQRGSDPPVRGRARGVESHEPTKPYPLILLCIRRHGPGGPAVNRGPGIRRHGPGGPGTWAVHRATRSWRAGDLGGDGQSPGRPRST